MSARSHSACTTEGYVDDDGQGPHLPRPTRKLRSEKQLPASGPVSPRPSDEVGGGVSEGKEEEEEDDNRNQSNDSSWVPGTRNEILR